MLTLAQVHVVKMLNVTFSIILLHVHVCTDIRVILHVPVIQYHHHHQVRLKNNR